MKPVVRVFEPGLLHELSSEIRHRAFCIPGLERCPAPLNGGAHDDPLDSSAYHFAAVVGEKGIGTARLWLGPAAEHPTGKLLPRMSHPPPMQRGVKYSEPSRLGIVPEAQRSTTGLNVLWTLIGALVELSATNGYDHFLVTLRPQLFSVLRWFPWELGDAFEYPADEGGPMVPEPMWPAVLSLPELVMATAWFNRPAQHIMFPQRPTWLKHRVPVSRLDLDNRKRRNWVKFNDQMRRWQNGEPLPQLKPPSG